MAQPKKRGGRVTPKGTGSKNSIPRHHSRASATPEASPRYTPPVPASFKVSPWWVPVLMFTLLGLGVLVIILNYIGIMGDANNARLLIGLGLVLAGIVTATQYH